MNQPTATCGQEDVYRVWPLKVQAFVDIAGLGQGRCKGDLGDRWLFFLTYVP